MAKRKSQFRQKREDAKVGTVEKQYGRDFGVRSDKNLGSYLKEQGYSSLSELLTKSRGRAY